MGTEQFLTVHAGPADNAWALSVRRFTVTEALSTLFSVRLIVNSKEREIDLESIVGQPAWFQHDTGKLHHHHRVRRWAGICAHAEQVQVERLHTLGESVYGLHLVPLLWLTTQRVRSRIFQHLTLPDIVKKVLGEWGIPFGEALDRTYKKHEYVVQYAETDFAFLGRLMEWAGISYFFKAPDGGGGGAAASTLGAIGAVDAAPLELTLSDRVEKNPLRSHPLHFVDNPADAAQAEHLSRVAVVGRVRPGRFTVRDHDFRRKITDQLTAVDNVPLGAGGQRAPEDFYDQYHYHPGRFHIEAKGGGGLADQPFAYREDQKLYGTELAKRGLAAARRGRRSVRFATDLIDLSPGTAFAIENHPNDAVRGKKLLVERFSAEGAVSQESTFEGEALFAEDPYAPEVKTPKPRIRGVQSALVVGEGNEEVYVDEYGRVKVQFHWDLDGAYDQKSSCWIRVSHEWAGAGFGSMLLPRVGQEVLVAFLEGDPDLPVVIGRVYNAITQVPYPLPKNATRSTWKSDSSKPGVSHATPGFNELMFEDLKGHELVYVQAELDLQKLVKQFETDRVGENHMTIVGKNRSAVVKRLDATMVGQRHLLRVIDGKDKDGLSILPQKDPNPAVSPHDTAVEVKDKRVIFTTGGASLVLDGPNVRFEASGTITLMAASGDTILEGKHVYLNSKSPPDAPRPASFTLPTPGLKRQ